jgi:glycosyltransferase involved in cell wall biosynthesis
MAQCNGSGIEVSAKPAVVIIGPPWPHSGTARVIENQIEYYRNRGFLTVFICIPIHNSFTEGYPQWEAIKGGIEELGADRIFFAPIDYRRFLTAKYTAWVGHMFRGTALDWIVFTAKSARLPEEAVRFLGELEVVLVHVNHVFTIGFAERLLRRNIPSGRNVPILLETHDVQSHLLEDRGEINPWTHRRDSLRALVRSEVSQMRKARVLVHLSVDDFAFFKLRLPRARHVLAMPTIDEKFVASVDAATSPSEGPIDLLFVGQSTDPNRAAIKWFFELVWPLIADRGYSLKIVGQIDMLASKYLPEIYQAFRSHFVGPVPDLASVYRSARCVFAPMVSGTGISIKTIEALSLGKPFVGTLKAYRGMPLDRLRQAGLSPKDSPAEFAGAIVEALAGEQQAAAASRAAYKDLFSKEAAFRSRDEAFRLATSL